MDYIREAIEYLKTYKDLQYAVINLKEEVQKLDAELQGGAMVYSDMPGGGSAAVQADDKMLNKIYRIEMAKKEYSDSNKTIRRIDRILEELNLGDGKERHGDILRQWFIERRDRQEIANEMGYSMSQLYRIKDKALRRLGVQLFGIKVIK